MANLIEIYEKTKAYPNQGFDSWTHEQLQIRLDAEEVAHSISDNSIVHDCNACPLCALIEREHNKQSESLFCPNCKSVNVEDLIIVTDMACKNCSFKWKA